MKTVWNVADKSEDPQDFYTIKDYYYDNEKKTIQTICGELRIS